ncbi:MAG: tripartite tricarboxylate transporter TctB family protein [Burkholderiales bacterium]|nr:tripartite tricarboxylate transporter TctB family protein [Burkholderiales bacterium]
MSAPHSARLRRLAPYALVSSAGLFLFYIATQFDFHHRAGTLGPDFWPKLILALLVIVCAGEIARILFANNPDADIGNVLEEITLSADTGSEPELPEPAASNPWRLLAGMAATLGYVALVATTGFFLTTAAYLAAFLVIGGYRQRKRIILLSVGGALLLMFVFMKLVYVSLPLGSGPFAELTFLLMRLMGIR